MSTDFNDAALAVCTIDDEAEIRRNGTLTAQFLKSVLQIETHHKVLEIGCGIARVGLELAPFCGEWHGADISGNMIKYARQRTAGVKNIFLHELPKTDLSLFGDKSFDAVYSTIVFMHLDKTDVFRYIREAYRVLKPGCIAYFDTFNLLAPEGWQVFLSLVSRFSSGCQPGHVSQFSTPQEMHKFVSEAGFSSVMVEDSSPALVTVRAIRP